MKKIRASRAPAKKGKCSARPPLIGVLKNGRVVNPMLFCSYDKGHRGKHSWEKVDATRDAAEE
jgi:hypothetical protein